MNSELNTFSQPRVTVITIVFNDVAHIAKTMDTVLNQTYPNIEYIVIDGGSTDGTAEVVKQYGPRLAYWVSEVDKGMSDALNKAIDHATGDYVNIINSGDYFMSNTVFAEVFERPRRADILYGSFIGNFNGQPVECVAPESATRNAWQGMQVCHTTLFVRLPWLQKFRFSTTLRVSPDTDFVLRCVAAGCTFERVEVIIFRVGTLGNSAKHWLRGRVENWQIARTYFPGLRTDFWHARHLVQESTFRIVKAVTSCVGVYQLARWLYRTKLKHRISLLPKNVKPFQD